MDSLNGRQKKKKKERVIVVVIRCSWARGIGNKCRSGFGRFCFDAEMSGCFLVISFG